jgi:hypothetical protein
MAGYPLNQNELDQRLGRATVGLTEMLAEWQDLSRMLNDTDILGIPSGQPDPLAAMGYLAADITNIRGGAGDLGGAGASLIQVAYGKATVPGLSNFLFHAKHLAGARISGGAA